jgi:hypothetical protein
MEYCLTERVLLLHNALTQAGHQQLHAQLLGLIITILVQGVPGVVVVEEEGRGGEGGSEEVRNGVQMGTGESRGPQPRIMV